MDNLGLILDSTRFTKPKVHAEVREASIINRQKIDADDDPYALAA